MVGRRKKESERGKRQDIEKGRKVEWRGLFRPVTTQSLSVVSCVGFSVSDSVRFSRLSRARTD